MKLFTPVLGPPFLQMIEFGFSSIRLKQKIFIFHFGIENGAQIRLHFRLKRHFQFPANKSAAAVARWFESGGIRERGNRNP